MQGSEPEGEAATEMSLGGRRRAGAAPQPWQVCFGGCHIRTSPNPPHTHTGGGGPAVISVLKMKHQRLRENSPKVTNK